MKHAAIQISKVLTSAIANAEQAGYVGFVAGFVQHAGDGEGGKARRGGHGVSRVRSPRVAKIWPWLRAAVSDARAPETGAGCIGAG